MRRLIRGLRRRLRRRAAEERGAVAVVVALFMVPLLGFAAIAVDVGALYADRQALRNGADAAALAVATDCARAACGNTVQTATTLAAANTGTAGATLRTPTVSVTGNRVTVTTRAEQPHWFAPVLGHDSSTVSATSAAAWTGIDRATAVLPLAISYCEFQRRTAANPLTDPDRRVVTILSDGSSGCAGPAGGTTPGGLVWLETDSTSECRLTTEAGSSVRESRSGLLGLFGVVPSACQGRFAYLLGLVGTTVYLPVFDSSSGRGGNTTYRIHGFAAFRLDGYGSSPLLWPLQAYLNVDPGLRGSFVTSVELSDASAPVPAPDLGVRSVYLTEVR